jgi:NADH-quinone oxidoreductase subunit I
VIVKRTELKWWERLYIPAVLNGFRVTLRHFFRRKVTMQYPEEKWVVPPGYRGAPYLVKDQEAAPSASPASCASSSVRRKRSASCRPARSWIPDRGNVEKKPREFEINMLRCIFCGFCQEVCPEEAIFLMEDYSLTGGSRRRWFMICRSCSPWGDAPRPDHEMEAEGRGSRGQGVKP